MLSCLTSVLPNIWWQMMIFVILTTWLLDDTMMLLRYITCWTLLGVKAFRCWQYGIYTSKTNAHVLTSFSGRVLSEAVSPSYRNHVLYPWRWWTHTKVWSHSLSDRRIHSNSANLCVSLSVLSQNRKEHSSTYQGVLVRTYSCRDFWRCRVYLLGDKWHSKSIQLKNRKNF